ncbi:hypothetical protein [Nocardiopsis tropica]|uniref:Transcriptional regulator SbtR-like C-terminal domain-containing protein n=1 Tax=Nocardiopsis tropica TaxID=109330 RepID=A0ABU7KN72_9ACTN|nr:hypothetical protein [Nocardiopsis umidischolae]MEE2050474.1 hypothetical protein [Nocardiopsis umidischolae]
MSTALHSGDPAYDGLPEQLLDRLEPASGALLTAAVEAGDVRDDVSARDLMTAVALMSQPVRDAPAGFNRRTIGVFLDGLRVTGPERTS